MLKSQAYVVGDIHHQSLAIEKGAYFEGRSVQTGRETERQLESVDSKRRKQIANHSQEPHAAIG